MIENGKAVLYGINSLAFGCGNPEAPDVFGDVYAMKTFIDDFLVRIIYSKPLWDNELPSCKTVERIYF